MDYEEIMADVPNDQPETDDLSVDQIVEEVEEASESLDSILSEESEEAQPEEQTEEPVAKEPGYVRGRIDKAVQKTRAEMQAEFDQQIADLKASFEAQMAPFRARMIEEEAQELVRSRKITDIETAREFVRMKNGQTAPAAPAPEQPKEQPRQANGQFAANEDPATTARISMLEHQADRINAESGIDVVSEFINNEEIKAKVISGEMDFYDVAKQMQSQQRKRPPSPMRSPNGASGVSPNAIENMTDEQFARMERNIKERGARYELR